MGLLVLAYMSSGPMPKTLTMAALGLLLGMIGIDPMSGYNRFACGVHELSDGLGVRAGGGRAVRPVGDHAGLPQQGCGCAAVRLAELMPSREDVRDSVGPIGAGRDRLPDRHHSGLSSHPVVVRILRGRETALAAPEQFGKGAVEGVAGPESANNAAASGAFVPMLALGVPLGPVQAILIAVLMVHGVAPGPLLITQQPQLFWGFIASMYIGNLVLLVLNLPLVGLFVTFLRLPYSYLYPIILVCCIVGVYTVNSSMVDVLIMTAAGAAGYMLRRLQYDVAPVVLGFILSPMLEMAFRQSLAMSGGDYSIFLERPIAVTLLAIGAACCCWTGASALAQALAPQSSGAMRNDTRSRA